MSSLAINKGKEVFATVFTGTVGLRELARKIAGGKRIGKKSRPSPTIQSRMNAKLSPHRFLALA